MRMKPFSLSAALALFFVLLSQPGFAKVFKIATVSPEGSGWMKTMRAAGKDIEAATEGRVKLKFYPGGVMGNDSAVLRKIRIRQLHGAALTGGSLRQFYPDVEAYSLPLLFRSFAEVDHVRQQMDSKILSGLADGGFISFGIAEGGLAYAMSDTPVTQVAQLREKKVWAPANDKAALQAMRAFDISPYPLELSNVLVSLQTGMINSVATSPIAAIALQWHTQVKYISDLPLMYFFATLVLEKRAFESLSTNDQNIVSQRLEESFAYIDQQNRMDNENAFSALQQQGLKVVNIPATDQQAWHQRADKATAKIIDDGLVSRDFYSEMQRLLDEFRNQGSSGPLAAN
ncbi:MAG: TRAP transporter substrate-binding protein DctP [Pseudomonadota bacterium]